MGISGKEQLYIVMKADERLALWLTRQAITESELDARLVAIYGLHGDHTFFDKAREIILHGERERKVIEDKRYYVMDEEQYTKGAHSISEMELSERLWVIGNMGDHYTFDKALPILINGRKKRRQGENDD